MTRRGFLLAICAVASCRSIPSPTAESSNITGATDITYSAFVEQQLRLIAKATGVPYAALIADRWISVDGVRVREGDGR